MGQEDDQIQTQRCSNSYNNSSGGGGIGNINNNIGRSLKKQRPKKVPQRGLGVAQLEKMRIEEEEEEQQKKDAGFVSSSPTVSHKSIPSFHLSNQSSSSSIHFPYENEPIWALPSLMQRSQTFQQLSSSMVNNLTSISSSSTSILNFQMEPPSNQSYYGNCTCLLPDKYKVIGMKRRYPLSLDNVSIVHSINEQVEVASSSDDSTFNFESRTPNLRKGRSCSASNGVIDGDFLTLAPPATTSMSSSSKFKHPRSNLINSELAYQKARFEDSILQTGSVLEEYGAYYSFVPQAMVHIDRANCNGDQVAGPGHVDLNLKL